jgi:ureidoglycolate dehydrogenase (NAD+)
MQRAMQKAREVGIGWGVIRNTTHQGAIGYSSRMAALEGMAGIALVCSPPNMAPYGAKAPGVHNSPITIAVPGRRPHPLLLDMSTSIAAGGKLRLAVDRGTPIPQGWALTKVGEPTPDPNLASVLLPAGGPKGSGLALMFETLTGLMAGNPVLIPMLLGHERVRRHRQNSVVTAINIATFTDLERYRQGVDYLIEGLKTLPKADGTQEILAPGELEARTCVERTRDGIPLPEGTVGRLRAVAERFSVEMPRGL